MSSPLRYPAAPRPTGTGFTECLRLPPRVAGGLPIVGRRALLGGWLAQRRFSIADVRWKLDEIEQHVAQGHCRQGDEPLELVLAYPLAMQAAVRRGNSLNLRFAEKLRNRGRDIFDDNRDALGPVPHAVFLEAEAAVMGALGERAAQLQTLEELRRVAHENGRGRLQRKVEALLTEGRSPVRPPTTETESPHAR